MIPVLFGSRARPLVGFLLPARRRSVNRVVVLCPPFGIESLRSDRALRVLGDRLSDAGVDVLRFDWFGTGDSGGDHREVSLDGAAEDLRAAIDEAISVSGASKPSVVLIGHRHGTLPAVQAAGSDDRVERVVLWDPVSPAAVAREWRDAPDASAPGGRWANGFAISTDLIDEMEAFDDLRWSVVERVPTLLIHTAAPLPGELIRRTQHESWPGRVEHMPGPGTWEETTELGAGAVPHALLQAITRWCT